MPVNRRQLLLGAATAVLVRPVHSAPIMPPPPSPPMNDFGYSLDGGEYWTTGFGSHEEALAEALSDVMPGDVVTTAVTSRLPMQLPSGLSLVESVVDALLNGGGNIGDVLAAELQLWNQDIDYEGQFDEAVAMAPLDHLPQEALVCVQAALRRHGWHHWAETLQGAEVLPEADDGLDGAALEALASDAMLEKELQDLLAAWAHRHDLQNEIRALLTRDEHEHTIQAI